MKDLFGRYHPVEDPPSDQERYQEYLRSAARRRTREAAIERAGGRCEKCRKTKWSVRLEVHHLTYKRLGKEKPEDLQVLCKDCHSGADIDRKVENVLKWEQGPMARGFENWMDRGNNGDWRDWIDGDLEYEWQKFLDYLERKNGRSFETKFRRSSEW